MSKVSNIPVNKKGLSHFDVKFEVKAVDDSDDEYFRFEGLASTFDNIDLVDDIVRRGAFLESIAKRLPIILWQHSSFEPIGMPELVEEREEGLYIRVRLPRDDSLVKGRVIPQIKVGSIRTMSIGFRIPKGGMYINEDGIRELIKVDLMEVSLVTFPANPMARVVGFKALIDKIEDEEIKEQLEQCFGIMKQISIDDLKFLDGIEEPIKTKREFENILRESGIFSKNAAVKLAGYFNLSESEEESEESEDDSAFESELGELKGLFDNHKRNAELKSILSMSKTGE